MDSDNIAEYDSATFTREVNKTITRPQKRGVQHLPNADLHKRPPPGLPHTNVAREPNCITNEKVEQTQPKEKPTAQVTPSFSQSPPSSISVQSNTSPQSPLTSQKIMNVSVTESTSSLTPSTPVADGKKAEDKKPRQRQQTVVVPSTHAQDIRAAFQACKAAENPLPLDEVEKKMISLLARVEKEGLYRLDKIRKDSAKELAAQKAQSELNLSTLIMHVEELQKQIRLMPKNFPAFSVDMTASTALSPDDVRTLKKEKDMLESELQSVHEAYRNMFSMYEQLKSLNRELKEDNENLRETEQAARDQLRKMGEKYQRMVEQAKDRLHQANDCIAQLEKKCDDDTVTLRARLRQKELQLDAALQQLEIKKRETEELNDICHALIQKAECVSDGESSS